MKKKNTTTNPAELPEVIAWKEVSKRAEAASAAAAMSAQSTPTLHRNSSLAELIAGYTHQLETNLLEQEAEKAWKAQHHARVAAAPKVDALEEAAGDDLFAAASLDAFTRDAAAFDQEEVELRARLEADLAALADRRDCSRAPLRRGGQAAVRTTDGAGPAASGTHHRDVRKRKP